MGALALIPMFMPVLQASIAKIIPDAGQAAQATIEMQKALLDH